MDERRFSERHGFAPGDAEITIRYDAPHDLRGLVADYASSCGLSSHRVRSIACKLLMTRPDDDNWSAPNVDREARRLLDDCEWFEVYDVIEAIYESLRADQDHQISNGAEEKPHDCFASLINKFFAKKGIGWQLTEEGLEIRGPEAFEAAVRPVVSQLQAVGMRTAAQEIHESLNDLSRRPDPDITGAIQHAMAAAECVARQAANDPKATLGEILKRHPGLVPPPMDEALKKMWGYASEKARHLREGRLPSFEEAELAVFMSAGVVTYLERKLRSEK